MMTEYYPEIRKPQMSLSGSQDSAPLPPGCRCSGICCCSVAKSRPTLGDLMDSILAGILCPWDKARTLQWVAFPSPGDLPHPGTESFSLASPALRGGFYLFICLLPVFPIRM